MKQVNCTVSGRRTDTPLLRADEGTFAATVVESPTRVVFEIADHVMGGATILYGGKETRVLLPKDGAQEGPVLDYAPAVSGLRIVGDQFYRPDGERWLMKGATEFRALDLFCNDRDQFNRVCDQRQQAGANTLRSLSMKWDNTGWAFAPRNPQAQSILPDYCEALAARGLYGLYTVFADTRAVMPSPSEQHEYWQATCDVMRAYPHMLVQLCNEWDHPTQAIDPSQFSKPDGILACHGSGQTDANPVAPRWDFACYHARRDRLPDARGITNYSCYEFQARFPQPGPLIPAEGLKPTDYDCNQLVARLMGEHAALGAGGFFHSSEGVNGALWPDDVRACATAFYEAMA